MQPKHPPLQSTSSSHDDVHELIHLDDALERHLSKILDQESERLSSLLIAHDIIPNENQMMMEQEPKVAQGGGDVFSDALYRIMSSDEYARLCHELQQDSFRPPPLLRPPVSLSSNRYNGGKRSFSLFDDMAQNIYSSGHHPGGAVNIRDLLECHGNMDELLKRSMNCNAQDLILDFNTTQHEIETLANHLYHGLKLEMVTREDISNDVQISTMGGTRDTFLGLHQKWFRECVVEDESLSFAFRMVQNVMFLSGNGHCKKEECLVLLVNAAKEMMYSIMERWTDVGMFQQEWFNVVYIWIRCSFRRRVQRSPHDVHTVHAIWSRVDPWASLLDLSLKCMSSTWMIQLLLIKTQLVGYLLHVLVHAPHCVTCKAEDDCMLQKNENVVSNRDGLLIFHTIAMLRIIIFSSSSLTWFYPHGDMIDLNAQAQPQPQPQPRQVCDEAEEEELTLEMIKEELRGIHDRNVEELNQCVVEYSSQTLPCRNVQYFMAPFLVLIEIGLTDIQGHDSENQHVMRHHHHSTQVLLKWSAECLGHILCTGLQHQEEIFCSAIHSFFELVSKISKTCINCNELPLGAVACFNVVTQVSQSSQKDVWCRHVARCVQDVIVPFIDALSDMTTIINFESWNEALKVLEPILNHYHAYSSHISMERIRELLSNYRKAAMNSGNDWHSIWIMIHSTKVGQDVLKKIDDAF